LEIENVLFAHPAISEVSVVGLPDSKYGECVAAFVLPNKGDAISAIEVRDYVREKLSGFMVPKYVFRIEDIKDGLPKTGKFRLFSFFNSI